MTTERPRDDDALVTKTDLHAAVDGLRTELKDDIRALGVVIERVDTNVRLLAESMTGMRTELKNDLAELEARLSVRITRLEDAVRTNSRDIRDLKTDVAVLKTDVAMLKTDVTALKTDMSDLRQEVAELRRDFERRDATRLTALEARVTELEKRTGIA